jgi:glycosyltransferase involved in cell wall biosynthesis
MTALDAPTAAGATRGDEDAQLREYVDASLIEGLRALFDTRYYLETNPHVAALDESPLVHYLREGAAAGADPSPYFDTEYYYSQEKQLARGRANALVHYVEHGALGQSCNPNPLFGNGYYLGEHADLRDGRQNPLAHYLQRGRLERRAASVKHAELTRLLHAERGLWRGQHRHGSALFFLRGSSGAEAARASRELLVREHNLDVRMVFVRRPAAELPPGSVVLEDHQETADVLRPSALRFLALSLASESLVAVGDVGELLPGCRTAGIPAYLLVLEETAAPADLDRVAREATRVVFGSQELFQRVAGPTGPYPPNCAVRSFEPETAAGFVRATLELAGRDGAPILDAARRSRPSGKTTRKVLVPCTDWGLSGVNTALEAVGQELIRRRWDVEIVFTRDRSLVEESLGDTRLLPELPHRWLARERPGVEGMWEALIAEAQAAAPCILFTGYDFYGNSIVPALTNDVGVVMWTQADDGDYYEQAYRLGPYCNAIVCVSSRIRDQVASLHPGLATRAHVIHNTSVRDVDVLPFERRRSAKLRIVYTGRLVQYQKRVLDFVPLTDELEALGLDFTIDLIGTAPGHDEAATLLPERAARHVRAGRMRLLGRLTRTAVLEELRAADLFVLLSDFEGLPLSLVEAMASGCVPVVAEMESGISELLVSGENGLVVQGRDYREWARTIRDLWQDETRIAAMAEGARQTVRSSFTLERIGEQFEDLFGTVAEELADGYERPPALTWGPRRAPFGDVLPPPPMYRAVPLAGLG